MRYVASRLLLLVPTLLGVSIIVFLLVHLAPGDPAELMLGSENATPEAVASIRHQLGLDQPLPIQYLQFVGGVVRGDLGHSFTMDMPVADLIGIRLEATMELALVAMVIALLISIPLGVLAAVKRYSFLDNLSALGSTLGVSMPSFWLGLLLILGLAYYLRWLPPSGRGGPLLAAIAGLGSGDVGGLLRCLSYLAMPAITLGAGAAALLTRITRSAMLEVLGQEYVRTARAKGLRERAVIARHALKNAMIPVVTIVGLDIGAVLGGAVIVETVFAWPGVGRLAVQMILHRDYPVVQGIVLTMALIFAFINLVVDLIYAVLDPRIRLS